MKPPSLKKLVMAGYMDPTASPAYRGMAGVLREESARSGAETAAAYAQRGLGQSGYATAAGQQEQRGLGKDLGAAAGQVSLAHLAAALGIREQDLARMLGREQAKAGMLGSLISAGGVLGGAAILGGFGGGSGSSSGSPPTTTPVA